VVSDVPAENHIKAWKNHLAADRTSCHEATANQFRLFLHAGAYWLLWSMRRLMPKGSAWRVMQFDTLRLRLIKIAARVVELKKQIKIHLPSSTPDQSVFGIILNRLPRLVTCPPPYSCEGAVWRRRHWFRDGPVSFFARSS